MRLGPNPWEICGTFFEKLRARANIAASCVHLREREIPGGGGSDTVRDENVGNR